MLEKTNIIGCSESACEPKKSLVNQSHNLKLYTNDLNAYLAADKIVDADHLSIIAIASELTLTLDSDIKQATALFEWVRDRIPHTFDANRQEVTCSASQVLAVGTGLCYAKSHLLAALLRSVSIPAGFCYQVYFEEMHSSASKIALHGLNAVYLGSIDRWIRLDSRGNTNGIDAKFSLELESLAFPELEFLDDFIYARPLPQVIALLQTWPTLTQLWPNLPGPSDPPPPPETRGA